MALAFTTSIELGYKAPAFTLVEPLSGLYKSLNELQGEKATVVMFICNHCPYVKHINHQLVKIANDYMSKGIAFIAINSNDAEAYPEDSPEKMIEVVKVMQYPFPYLFDETQAIARAYNAVCTPDFSVFDASLRCIYRGQLDESRPGNGKEVNGNDLRQILDQILKKEGINQQQIPSAGCSIKWK